MADNGKICSYNLVVYASMSICDVPIDPASRRSLRMNGEIVLNKGSSPQRGESDLDILRLKSYIGI